MVKLSYYGYMPVVLPTEIEVEPGQNLKELMIRLLEERDVNLEEFFFENLVCLNGGRMEDDSVLKDGDVIDIFPPAIMG